MATVTYFMKATKKDASSIYVRFRAGRGIDQYTKTGLYIEPDNWSQKAQAVRQRAQIRDKDTINKKLVDLEAFIISCFNAIDGPPHPGWLQDMVENFNAGRTGETDSITLFSFIEEFIKRAGTRLNPHLNKAIDTKQKSEYETTYQYLKDFCRDERKGRELDFKDINLDFYHNFIEYMERVKLDEETTGLALNTIGRKIQTLKVFMNAAIEEGKTTHQGHKSKRFIAPKEEPETIAMTEQELNILRDLDLTDSPRLDRVRDLFLIGCWTGCRFGDLAKIRPEDIKDGMLSVKQGKTGEKVVIPVHPVVEKILTKYQGMPPIISNQKFNKALQDLCKAAKFTEPVFITQTRGGITRTKKYEKWEKVGNHTGRRTFATIHYRAGFPAISLMRITGHRTERSFLRYIRVTDEEHAQRLREFWQKNANHLRAVK